MIYFNLLATIADVDETTPDNPLHPATVLLLEIDDEPIQRVVVPASVWPGLHEVLAVGRRVCLAGTFDILPKPGALPVAMHIELVDVH